MPAAARLPEKSTPALAMGGLLAGGGVGALPPPPPPPPPPHPAIANAIAETRTTRANTLSPKNNTFACRGVRGHYRTATKLQLKILLRIKTRVNTFRPCTMTVSGFLFASLQIAIFRGYIRQCRFAGYGDKRARNNRTGPGGSTRRLHQFFPANAGVPISNRLGQ